MNPPSSSLLKNDRTSARTLVSVGSLSFKLSQISLAMLSVVFFPSIRFQIIVPIGLSFFINPNSGKKITDSPSSSRNSTSSFFFGMIFPPPKRVLDNEGLGHRLILNIRTQFHDSHLHKMFSPGSLRTHQCGQHAGPSIRDRMNSHPKFL